MGYASDMKLDSHGRILLTPTLREYAQLDKEVMLIGQGNKFEVWDGETWRKQCADWYSRDHAKEGLVPEIANLSI
jgi:MraZ protein